MAADADMVVVASPGSATDADACFTGLMAGGFHPIAGYQAGGGILGRPNAYPVLVPKTELSQARAYLVAKKLGVPAKDQYEPPVPTSEQFRRVGTALLVMIAFIGVVTVLLIAAQNLMGQPSHSP